MLERGFYIVDRLRDGLQHYDLPDDEKLKLKLWSHRSRPLDDVKHNKMPYFDRQVIEAAVGEYLELPYRSIQIDHLFVDVLVAMELYAFAEKTIDGGRDAIFFPLTSKHPLLIYGTVMMCLGGLVLTIPTVHALNDRWVQFGTILAFAAFALVSLSFVDLWRKRKAAHAIARAMLYSYAELNSDGPISARRLLERLSSASEKGVMWPAPLYALMDDVIARTGRL